MLSLTSRGRHALTRAWLKNALSSDMYSALDAAGQKGVAALARATPVESGLTARSWDYTVSVSGKSATIEWYNTHVNQGVPIAILLQYGHGTGTGGFVRGRDYINPAIQPVFDQIADEVWEKVNK